MMYQYNYSFLQQWLEANKNIQKKDVLRALGVKSNNGLKKWTDMAGPMPVLNILRFCNSFQVPLACFFRDLDNDGRCDVTPEHPDINDQLEPDGGYDRGERGRGNRFYEDPTNCTVQPSFLPDGTATEMPIPSAEEHKKEIKVVEKIVEKVVHVIDTDALIALENKHSDQRKQLLDIIADQQKHIADLANRIERMKTGLHNHAPYGNIADTQGILASEPMGR